MEVRGGEVRREGRILRITVDVIIVVVVVVVVVVVSGGGDDVKCRQ